MKNTNVLSVLVISTILLTTYCPSYARDRLEGIEKRLDRVERFLTTVDSYTTEEMRTELDKINKKIIYFPPYDPYTLQDIRTPLIRPPQSISGTLNEPL